MYTCQAANIAEIDSGNVTPFIYFVQSLIIVLSLGECPICYPPAKETLSMSPDGCPICATWAIEVNSMFYQLFISNK